MNEHKNIITIEDEIKEFSDKPVKSSALFKALQNVGGPGCEMVILSRNSSQARGATNGELKKIFTWGNLSKGTVLAIYYEQGNSNATLIPLKITYTGSSASSRIYSAKGKYLIGTQIKEDYMEVCFVEITVTVGNNPDADYPTVTANETYKNIPYYTIPDA